MDIAKIRRESNWEARETFDSGLHKTVSWYLDNCWWWEAIWSQKYPGSTAGDRWLIGALR